MLATCSTSRVEMPGQSSTTLSTNSFHLSRPSGGSLLTSRTNDCLIVALASLRLPAVNVERNDLMAVWTATRVACHASLDRLNADQSARTRASRTSAATIIVNLLAS